MVIGFPEPQEFPDLVTKTREYRERVLHTPREEIATIGDTTLVQMLEREEKIVTLEKETEELEQKAREILPVHVDILSRAIKNLYAVWCEEQTKIKEFEIKNVQKRPETPGFFKLKWRDLGVGHDHFKETLDVGVRKRSMEITNDYCQTRQFSGEDSRIRLYECRMTKIQYPVIREGVREVKRKYWTSKKELYEEEIPGVVRVRLHVLGSGCCPERGWWAECDLDNLSSINPALFGTILHDLYATVRSTQLKIESDAKEKTAKEYASLLYGPKILLEKEREDRMQNTSQRNVELTRSLSSLAALRVESERQ